MTLLINTCDIEGRNAVETYESILFIEITTNTNGIWIHVFRKNEDFYLPFEPSSDEIRLF